LRQPSDKHVETASPEPTRLAEPPADQPTARRVTMRTDSTPIGRAKSDTAQSHWASTAAVLVLLLLAGCSSAANEPPIEGDPAAAVIPVVTLQENLAALGLYTGRVDGSFSPAVVRALREFQRAAGIEQSGEVDGATAAALAVARGGQTEGSVAALQTALTELGLFTGEINGRYDDATRQAVMALQRRGGIPVDGDYGSKSAKVLVDLYRKLDRNAGPLQPDDKPADDARELKRGSTGPAVEAVQRRLVELGYRPGATDGRFGEATASAVLAFQKREGLPRSSDVDDAVQARLRAPKGAGPRSGGPGPRIEVDIARQILFVVLPSGVTTVNVSTGNNETYRVPGGGTDVAYTPLGNYTIERRVNGSEKAPLGTLYRPMYFVKGWAIHGSASVPAYPASHGCVRTANPDQDWIFDNVPNGATVAIYDPSGKSPIKAPADAGAGF
jgi:peptidoglycan hydrolase-like protein with peptidoglycan-binding domain